MANSKTIDEIVRNWLIIAQRDLLTAQQGTQAGIIITETICYHCQQTAEKALKAFLVKHQVEFPKTHHLSLLINLCSNIDASFQQLDDADALT
ncbi:HEPN domain-containing protein, partial [candidate division KSB1 bacterium]|nr:HEPN domain-containing protein [candidate division KSB1 bacterium]